MNHDRTQRSGQALPFFAIIFPGLLALMALGLDGAQIYLERRDAQAAADLAALSGARSLSGDADQAKADAVSIAGSNGYGITTSDVITPYGGDATKVRVNIDTAVDTWFMPILDFFSAGSTDYSHVPVSAYAVAQQATTPGAPGGPGYAMFSLEGSCGANEKAIDLSGSDNTVNGSVHAESNIYNGGNDNTINGGTTYNCDIEEGDNSNVYTPAPQQQDADPPVSYDWNDYKFGSGKCDFVGPSGDKWDFNDNEGWIVNSPGVVGAKTTIYQGDGKTLKPGVYCTRSTSGSDDKAQIVISRQGTKGNVTFVVGYGIDVSASDVSFTPHLPELLVYSNGNDEKAIQWQGSDGDVTGLWYAPHGTIDTSGSSNSSLTGGIIGRYINWSGSNVSLTGTIGAGGGSPPVQTIALIE